MRSILRSYRLSLHFSVVCILVTLCYSNLAYSVGISVLPCFLSFSLLRLEYSEKTKTLGFLLLLLRLLVGRFLYTTYSSITRLFQTTSLHVLLESHALLDTLKFLDSLLFPSWHSLPFQSSLHSCLWSDGEL